MVDTILTYAIVIVAGSFVLWRVVLPARARALLRGAQAAGKASECATEAGGGCGGGCSGCSLARAVPKAQGNGCH